ncbi:phage holin family protein [Candidatus Microgenomates bacterium]|nr:phage holin family protein [Candidatus Microgenomates bacterium]
MGIVISLLVNGIAVFVTAALLPGVTVDSFFTSLVVAVFLGIVNTFLRPILHIIALPITILTLGLFALVINALLVLLVSKIVPGFQVDGLLTAILFSVVLSVVGFFLGVLKF